MKTKPSISKKRIRILIITIALVSLAVFGGVIIYQMPAQDLHSSIVHVKKAIENRDIEHFTRYVDIEAIISGWLDPASESSQRKYADDETFGLLGGGLGEEFTALMKPLIIKNVENIVRDYIEVPDSKNLIDTRLEHVSSFEKIGLTSRGLATPLPYLQLKKIKQIKKNPENESSKMVLVFQDSRNSQKAELTIVLIENEELWRITSIPNFTEFLRTLQTNSQKDE